MTAEQRAARDAESAMRILADADRIRRYVAERVTVTDRGCHEWMRTRNDAGYGIAVLCGKVWRAHRLAFLLTRGALTPGLQLDHLCRNRACCNPDHLEEVTNQENAQRGDVGKAWAAKSSARTHCKHGHPFATFGTHVDHPDGHRRRACRECNRLRYHRSKTSSTEGSAQ